ncbi:MAG: diaminopropionate ammonia-lyase, partial [Candidatus Marinamargulisbacteria bacterium]
LLKLNIPTALKESDSLTFHQALATYQPTPLESLPNLAKQLNIGKLWVKDDSKRFGLNAFKALGASFAIHRTLLNSSTKNPTTFCTATDGNHGRAVAWSAAQFGHKSVIYVPDSTVEARIQNIKNEGAEVIIFEGNYDESVKKAYETATENNWVFIQDTAWKDYVDIPCDIMAGYLTQFIEMESQINTPDIPQIDFVFLQAGVGSWAAAAIWYYVNRYQENSPTFICVEPTTTDCFFESILNGKISATKGSQKTIMAGLNCGTPSSLAWPFLKFGVTAFLRIEDEWANKAMKIFYHPQKNDPEIISGESGAAGLAGLLALQLDPRFLSAKTTLGLTNTSRVLVINTEGDTDPEAFQETVKTPASLFRS